jgi:hypothetical protein
MIAKNLKKSQIYSLAIDYSAFIFFIAKMQSTIKSMMDLILCSLRLRGHVIAGCLSSIRLNGQRHQHQIKSKGNQSHDTI